MKCLTILLGVLGVLLGCSSNERTHVKSQKVLFVVTSHDRIEKAGKDTGAFLTEITHPYSVLKEAGVQVDFVSPKGGKTPLDGIDQADETSKTLLAQKAFRTQLHSAMTPDQVQLDQYSAIYFAGGHGTMFDLPDNKALQRITAKFYEKGGVVGAVCHGPAGLVNVKLSDGDYLVSGKKVAAFTNEEEKAVELTDAMPFLLEDRLKERGAEHVQAGPFQEKVVVSDRLVTGQNPASAEKVGKELLRLMRD